LRILQERKAEDAAAGRQVSAERVGRADDGVLRDQPQRPRRDPVVLGHLGGARLHLLAAREVAPDR
jgi:hypothetical protein